MILDLQNYVPSISIWYKIRHRVGPSHQVRFGFARLLLYILATNDCLPPSPSVWVRLMLYVPLMTMSAVVTLPSGFAMISDSLGIALRLYCKSSIIPPRELFRR